MRTMPRLFIRIAAVIVVPVALAAQTSAPVVARVQIQPDALTWSTAGGGIQTAAVLGDPAKARIYVTRLRFAKGTRIAPHMHPDERVAVVLSGSMDFGYGNAFDESTLTHMTAGSTWTEPPNTGHFARVKDEDVVIQVVGIGPSGSKPAPK